MLYEKYGDQIIIGVIPDQFDPMTTSEEDQRAAAREFVEKILVNRVSHLHLATMVRQY